MWELLLACLVGGLRGCLHPRPDRSPLWVLPPNTRCRMGTVGTALTARRGMRGRGDPPPGHPHWIFVEVPTVGKRCAGCDNISRFEVLIDQTSMVTTEGVALAVKHLEVRRANHAHECRRLNRYRPRHLAVKR